MVLLPLKSQFVSLIFTLLTFFAELCLLHFVRALLARHQNRRLQRGHRLRVRSHLVTLSYLITFGSLLFIGLELVNSFLSDPQVKKLPETQRCVAVDSFLVAQDPPGADPVTDVALLRCLKIDNDGLRLAYHAGNYSLSSRTVQCSENVLLSFPPREDREQDVVGARLPTTTDSFPDPMRFCNADQHCVVFRTVANPPNVTGTTIRFSDVIDPRKDYLFEEPYLIPFLETTLNVVTDARRHFPQMAPRLMDAYNENINDGFELRRRVFLGSRSGECEFDRIVDATSVPLPLALAALVAWGASVALGLVGCWVRAGVQYDLSDPMHWATKTVRRDGNEPQEGNEPFIEGAWENGHCVVYLTASQIQKQSMLDRLKRFASEVALLRGVRDIPRPPPSTVPPTAASSAV